MNRKNNFEKYKITKASTDKVVTNIYLDSFAIEKVRIQNANYNTKESIDYYLDFEQLSLLAADVATGRLINELSKGPKTLAIGGSKTSKNYDNAPESRILSVGRSDDTIFINITRGKGKITSTGAIAPDGKYDLKISVPMSIDKFRSMILLSHDAMLAYMAHSVNALVRDSINDRENSQTNS